MGEKIEELVTAYETGKLGSLVIVIPKIVREKLGISKGCRFLLKVDEKNRLIYEPIGKHYR